MRGGAVFLLLLLALAYQVLAAPLYRLGSAAPDFLFLALIYLAFFAPTVELLVVAVLSSVAVDLLSLDPLGSRVFGVLPALWLVSQMRSWFVVESWVFRWVLVLVAVLLASVLRNAYVSYVETGGPSLRFDFFSALYTTVVGLAVHGLLDGCRQSLGWIRKRHFVGGR